MKLQRLLSAVLFALGFILTTGLPGGAECSETKETRIELSAPKNLDECRVLVQELPESVSKMIAVWKPDDARWRGVFSLYVGESPKPDQPAVLGSFESTAEGFAFLPRFPLEPGTAYTAKLSLEGQKPFVRVLKTPARKPTEPTTIIEVYPTGDKLPENLLRLYLHFSAPMTQGRSYRHLHLFDQTGEEVEYPFLELPQELWSVDGKRLTVLLDPGRVKQGLKPREQSGPVLVPGVRYTLTIDAAWQDANGQPLEKPFKKTFTTTKADVIQPDPKQWKLTPPKAGTREPFAVKFDEPLDHAMLQRVLAVDDARHKEITGQIEIDQAETRWRFTPKEPWNAGSYQLKIRTHLEDRVGNSIGRPFEVDLNEPQPKEVPKVIFRAFAIPDPIP